MKSSSKKEFLTGLASSLALGLLLTLGACGKDNRDSEIPSVSADPSALNFAQSSNGQPQASNLSNSAVNSDAINRLLGSYTGSMQFRLQNGQWTQAAPYTLGISLVRLEGSDLVYAYLKFDVTHPQYGPIHFEQFMGLGYNGFAGMYWGFSSSPINAPAVSSRKFAIELILALRNSTTFDPTQSAIYIKDCGFSQGASSICSNNASDVIFNRDLRKR